MKTSLLAAAGGLLLAGSAFAGGFGISVNVGGYGCGPRYYTPPVCYTPRVVTYCPPPAVYYRPARVYYAPRVVYRRPVYGWVR
jgi:hypothetical protein